MSKYISGFYLQVMNSIILLLNKINHKDLIAGSPLSILSIIIINYTIIIHSHLMSSMIKKDVLNKINSNKDE